MTIIEPRHLTSSFNWPLIVLAGLLIMFAVASISIYNQNVSLKHEISSNLKLIENGHIANADYKNQFFQMLDSKKVETFAKERNFIQEKNPTYFETHAPLAQN